MLADSHVLGRAFRLRTHAFHVLSVHSSDLPVFQLVSWHWKLQNRGAITVQVSCMITFVNFALGMIIVVTTSPYIVCTSSRTNGSHIIQLGPPFAIIPSSLKLSVLQEQIGMSQSRCL